MEPNHGTIARDPDRPTAIHVRNSSPSLVPRRPCTLYRAAAYARAVEAYRRGTRVGAYGRTFKKPVVELDYSPPPGSSLSLRGSARGVSPRRSGPPATSRRPEVARSCRNRASRRNRPCNQRRFWRARTAGNTLAGTRAIAGRHPSHAKTSRRLDEASPRERRH